MAPRSPNQNQAQQQRTESVAEQIVGEALDLDLTNLTDGSNDDRRERDINDGGDDGDTRRQPSRQDRGRDDDGFDGLRAEGGDDDDAGDGQQQRQPERGRREDGDDAQQRRQQLDGLVERVTQTGRQVHSKAKVKADKRGNLVDESGNIVARAGREARYYNRAERAVRERDNARGQVTHFQTNLRRAVEIAQELNEQVTEYAAREKQIKELGITPQEQLEAVQLFTEGKRNPLDLLRKLLTRAAASGIDISTLGTGAGGGQDLKPVLDLIREEVAKATNPIREFADTARKRQQTEKERRDALTRTAEEVNAFFAANQDALPYMPVFESVKRNPQFAHMSLNEIWLRIQLLAARGGFRQPNPPRRRPQGRGQPQYDGGNGRDEDTVASPTESYDKILKDVFDKSGFGRSRQQSV